MRYKRFRGAALLCCLLLMQHWGKAQFGGNLTFDGTYNSVTTPSGMMNGLTTWTIEFFVKTTESRSNGTYWQRPTLVGNATAGDISKDFGITTDNGYIGMWAGLNSSTDNSFLSSTQINNNAWHHVAAVNNGSVVKLYVDGVFVNSLATGQGLITTTAPFAIGASTLDFGFSGNVGNKNFFSSGTFDEVRFSNNVRYTANFTVPTSAFTSDANTVALYHLDGCVSGAVPDASSNNNNGTPYGFTAGSCAPAFPPTPIIPSNPTVSNVSKAEYFFDADPGFGSGGAFGSFAAASDVTVNGGVNVSSLANGAHRLYIRTKNALGGWSLTNTSSFFIVPPSPTIPSNPAVSQVSAGEYFFDADPGFGAGTSLGSFAASTDVVLNNVSVNVSSLAQGSHRLYVRTKNAAGGWSLTNTASFYIVPQSVVLPANPAMLNVSGAEYFFDTDPGFGKGTPLMVSPSADVTLNNAVVNITGLSNGVHRLYTRTKNSAGKWSLTANNIFNIVVATAIIPANPAVGSITKFEYFFDTDPGFGNGTKVNVTATANLVNYTFAADISSLGDGQHRLYIRSYDDWGITTVRTFNKGSVLPVSWLSFTAQKAGDAVNLDWQTAAEKSNSKFDVERSKDGASFTAIGVKAGSGNSNAVNRYAFVDAQPFNGINYYRIRQTDADGHYTYSPVATVVFAGKGAFVVYPNPAGVELNLVYPSGLSSSAVLRIYNSSGAVIKQWKAQYGLQKVDVSGLASGAYTVSIVDGEKTFTQRVVVRQ